LSETLLDIGTVRFCRLDTDHEREGNLFAALALCQELNNFPLALGKSFVDRDRRRSFRILIAKTVASWRKTALLLGLYEFLLRADNCSITIPQVTQQLLNAPPVPPDFYKLPKVIASTR
jgi:hypothetical protein